MRILGNWLLIISTSKTCIQFPRTRNVKQVSSKLSHIDNYLEKDVVMKRSSREKKES